MKKQLFRKIRHNNRHPSNSSLDIGHRAEAAACKMLCQAGLALVARNYRCQFGEIDLIMRQGRQLQFVEVRFRRQPDWGSGPETVDYYKQRKLIKTARYFLQQHSEYQAFAGRFDVVGVRPADNNSLQFEFNWIKNAFEIQYNAY